MHSGATSTVGLLQEGLYPKLRSVHVLPDHVSRFPFITYTYKKFKKINKNSIF